MQRGIVMSPKFTKLPTGDVYFESAVDSAELLKYLLYWDQIEVPKSSIIQFDCSEFKFLEQAGVLSRTPYGNNHQLMCHFDRSHQISLKGSTALINDCTKITLDRNAGDEIVRAHDDVHMLLSTRDAGVWSKAQMSSTIVTSNPVNKTGVELELYNLLPVPSVGTDLNDVLEFKSKRHDELLAFRIYLDDLYQSIINSADIPRAYNTEMNRLELALRNLNRTMNESKIRVVIDSLRSLMSGMDGIIGLGAGLAGIATLLGVSPLIAGMSGAGIGVASKLIPQSSNAIPTELTYVKSIRKSLK
tara:strand:- start:127860 stop:128765 length:906 start_codon:yes stop_codon:yes gene_type:complete